MSVLVTGATGTVGRNVVDELVRAGHRVRALTRDPAAARLPAGVECAEGDLSQPQTLPPAFDGITALHLISFAGAGFTPLAYAPEIVELAVKAGVRKITVLSGFEEGPVESAVRSADVDWTILRPVEFMANALGWAETIRTGGAVREPFVGAASAKIHEADIAAVAATALLADGHAGRTYRLTGPEALTVLDSVRIISAAIDREIDVVEISADEVRAQLEATGEPAEAIESFLAFGADPPGHVSTVLTTVEDVTGRPARTFAQWVAANVNAFRPVDGSCDRPG